MDPAQSPSSEFGPLEVGDGRDDCTERLGATLGGDDAGSVVGVPSGPAAGAVLLMVRPGHGKRDFGSYTTGSTHWMVLYEGWGGCERTGVDDCAVDLWGGILRMIRR